MKQRELRNRAAKFETREQQDGTMKVSGYAIRFAPATSEDLGGFREQVASTALTRTLRDNPDVLLLRDHDSSKLLARTKANTLSLTVDDKGLRFSAILQPTDVAKDTWQNLKAGNLDACSFGFQCEADTFSTMPDGTPLRTLTDITLYEISICSFAAYPATSAEARSRAALMVRRSADGPSKEVDGANLPASSFAYVGDKTKPSTWALPIHFPGDLDKTTKHIRLALAMFSRTEGIPDSDKAEVYGRIVGAAKAHGIQVQKESFRDLDPADSWTDPNPYSDDDDLTGTEEGPFNADDDEDDEEDSLRADRLRMNLYFDNMRANQLL